jgi:hypothetical protein
MILGEAKTNGEAAGGHTTLDDVFRRAAARRPDAIAIADPPNRAGFTDGAPRRLSYAEADRIIGAIAARLRALGLQTDTVVGIQLPNTVEGALTILGVLRAGMIAAPLPLLWRRADAAAALGRIRARTIITASRVGEVDHCELAMQVAAEIFPVRYVCGFGTGLADGVIAFDELLTADGFEEPPAVEREGNPAAHVAVVTFDVTPDGLVAVARDHTQLIAGGVAAVLDGGLDHDAVILGCSTLDSFGGLALTMLPWLLTGGTLALQQPFDAVAFSVQCNFERCDTVVVPGVLLPRLLAAGLLEHPELANVLAVWRAPERLLISPPWPRATARLTDMLVFGEIGLLGAHRGIDGRPSPLPAGEIWVPPGSANAVLVAEVARSAAGTLALRGPMVPCQPFPPGAERLPLPHLRADSGGFVDTGYACRVDHAVQSMLVTGPPPGIVSVGGYRFAVRELNDLVRRADGGGALSALPDALAGHRLAGTSGDRDAVRAALSALGANPLVADAFRDQPNAEVA